MLLSALQGGRARPTAPPRPAIGYTAHGESDVQVSYRSIADSAGADLRPGTQTGCAANPSNQRRQAVDAGSQRTEVGARLWPGADFPADALEPSMGRLGNQPRRRPTHSPFGVQSPGNRRLRDYGRWSLHLRCQSERAEANGAGQNT